MKQVAFEFFELDIVGLIDFDLWRWEERNSWQKEYYEQIKKKKHSKIVRSKCGENQSS